MAKSRSRKGSYEREKWLIKQQICAILVFILTVLLCAIDMDFTPAIFSFLIVLAVFSPEK